MSLDLYRSFGRHASATRRGDTIIEVMFALAVFSLVAVISIAMMNGGVAQAENALENVTARSELNSQAEALRFVHSSYISEKTLPLRSNLSAEAIANGEKYQQYAALWREITNNAIKPDEAKSYGVLDLAGTVHDSSANGPRGCARMYEKGTSGRSLLYNSRAFVLNTRNLSSINSVTGQADVGISYVSIRSNPNAFTVAPLNARIIYAATTGPGNSISQFTDGGTICDRIKQAEGIWVVAVTDGTANPKYYDFYIETCWYGPGSVNPTSLDTVIRLYNPENV